MLPDEDPFAGYGDCQVHDQPVTVDPSSESASGCHNRHVFRGEETHLLVAIGYLEVIIRPAIESMVSM